MGLLDFFQKGGSTNGAGDDTTAPAVPDFAGIQQSYTNQSLANVSYPMASSNPYATSAPVAPAPQASVNPAQPMAVAPTPVRDIMDMAPQPSLAQPQVQEMNQPVNPQPVPMVNPMPVNNQPEPKDVPSYEYVDPSKHPVIPEVEPAQGHTETMPEGIKVTTFEPEAAPAPIDQPQAMPEVNNFEQSVTPSLPAMEPTMPTENVMTPEQTVMPAVQPMELPTLQNPTSLPAMDLPAMDSNNTIPTDNSSLLSTNNFESQQVEAPAAVADNTLPVTEVPVVETPTPEPAPAPEVDLNDGLEIGVGVQDSTNTEVTTQESTNNLEGTAEVSAPSVEPVAELPTMPVEIPASPEPIQAAETITEAVAPAMEAAADVIEEAPVEQTPAAEPTPEVVVPAVETQTEEVKEPVIETAPVAAPVEFEMSYFKTVGFIGLNTPQPNSKVVEKVADLASKLAEHSEVFILDSAKGYAKNVFESAKSKQIELMGMYLKPFHSDYSDEADLGEYDNFTVMMFSNAADKVKNIIKESDILVMPEISGLNNLSILFDIWSTNSMYPGQNKPLILLGKGWTSIVSQLKNLFRLTDADLGFVNICLTTEEALAKITELDRAFITKEVKAPRKIIDLREEDDEEGLFV